ncbi:MAG: DEAD/DEAH box helicase [Candidatus Riflebacteria bacterium]|nr:DEAD/DEAH box helicase [Candidatus Riflebacteria bacterium]
MADLNPLRFTSTLVETFRRYLFTAHPLGDSEQPLREAFWQALGQEYPFSSGPYFHCVPTYARGCSVQELISNARPPSLHPRLAELPRPAFDPARRLYKHQVDALTALQGGRNLLVASGTGSGKTECFLLPILDDILREPGPGVRAIVIYPLNALANDQLDRLRKLLRDLPEVTFGRYTGETPWDEKAARSDDLKECPRNERFLRTQLREDPPNLLLTNFSMLEYLLLRPKDSEVFRHWRLRFVVLDEAHNYLGAQGIEVALLLRRVREAFAAPQQPLRFVLTSATLMEQREDARAVAASMASNLTGGEFAPADVIAGETTVDFDASLGDRVSADRIADFLKNDEALDRWCNALDGQEGADSLLQEAGLVSSAELARFPEEARQLYHLLAGSKLLARLHEICSAQPRTLPELALELLGRDDGEARRVVSWLCTVGSRAKAAPDRMPLLPLRVHLFMRGLHGARVCLNPSCGEGALPWRALVLEDVEHCPRCGALALPLYTCTHCGMPALVIRQDGTSWTGLPVPPASANWGAAVLTWSELAERDVYSQDGDDVQPADGMTLCLSCQAVGQESARCCATPLHVTLPCLEADESGNLKKCPACGGQSGSFESVLRRFLSGDDAPTTVLAEALLRSLPPETGDSQALPAQGRRLLAFSDSRQRAAFFAPYLHRTMAEATFQAPLFQAVREAENLAGSPAGLEDVARRYVAVVSRQSHVVLRKTEDLEGQTTLEIRAVRTLGVNEKRQLQREATLSLFENFCNSPRQRRRMHGLGLAAVLFDLTEDTLERVAATMPGRLRGDPDSTRAVLHTLLSEVLRRRAVQWPDPLNGRMLGAGPLSVVYHLNQARQSSSEILRWNPYRADGPRSKRAVEVNRIVNYLSRLTRLDTDPAGEGARLATWLDDLWAVLTEDVLVRTGEPGCYALPPERLLFSGSVDWFRCSQCARMVTAHAGSVCPTMACPGPLRAVTREELEARLRNDQNGERYRLPPLPVVVREHTAQLNPKVGREYQHDFVDGKINVLSSSTTFELGVDVGQLKAVLLRNVPPTPASYIQRAGRAGQRLDGASYSVTYCRNVPHDQFHFFQPRELISGRVPVPRVNLRNPKLAQRQVNSFLLGAFLKSLPADRKHDHLTTGDFFQPAVEGVPAMHEAYADWVLSNSRELSSRVRRILPDETTLLPEDAMARSADSLSRGPECTAKVGFQDELATFDLRIDELMALGRKSPAAMGKYGAVVRHLSTLKDQFLHERLIDFLSRAGWLPGYAFPQDTVSLLIQQPSDRERLRLDRDREYGIAEYAPGAEVIADGKLYRSRGLHLKGHQPQFRYYRFCTICRRLSTGPEKGKLDRKCPCNRDSRRDESPRPYLRPEAFSTNVLEEAKEPDFARLRPPPITDIFLLAGCNPEQFAEHPELPGVHCGTTDAGKLFRANQGFLRRGFSLCTRCGASKPEPKPGKRATEPKEHPTHWGTTCSGKFCMADLAHEFTTDLLQVRFDAGRTLVPRVSDRTFWLSLLTSLLTATSATLAIHRMDLDGTYQAQTTTSDEAELVVYDRVPGGAGYVQQIVEHFPRLLEATRQLLASCTCDPEASCYRCMRSARNQFHWEHLRRRPVLDWLTRLVGDPRA